MVYERRGVREGMCGHHVCVINGVGGNGLRGNVWEVRGVYVIFGGEGMGG